MATVQPTTSNPQQVVTAVDSKGRYQYQAFSPGLVGKTDGNEEVLQAIEDVSNRKVNNPIGNSTFFFGRCNG